MSEKKTRGWPWSCRSLMTETDRRNINRFNFWLILWAVSFVLLTLVFKTRFLGEGWHNWALAMLPNVLGVMSIAQYIRFLRNADELLRKIQIEGLAIGFGAGAIFMLGYGLLELLGARPLNTADPMAVMFMFWAIGQWLGIRRYL